MSDFKAKRPDRRHRPLYLTAMTLVLLFMISSLNPGFVRAAESEASASPATTAGTGRSDAGQPEIASTAARLAAGKFHSAMIDYAGNLYLWGDNTYGQLGLSDIDYCDSPQLITLPGTVAEVSLGADHSLALTADGQVYAFGRNTYGQLGNQTTQSSSVPVLVASLPKIKAISAGAYHSLALGVDGSVWAWGDNTDMQIGDVESETITDSAGTIIGSRCTTPVMVVGSGAAAIAAGGQFSLYLDQDGLLHAWGDNSCGQLGDGTTQTHAKPVLVAGLDHIVMVSAGYQHVLAVSRTDENDSLYAWGDNSLGQLGLGNSNSANAGRTLPEQVDLSAGSGLKSGRILSIAAGYTQSAAVIPGTGRDNTWNWQRNSLLVWGNNTYGQLALGQSGSQNEPQKVGGLLNGYTGYDFDSFDAIAAGGFHMLLLSSKGLLAASGRGNRGQLGGLSILNRDCLTPVNINDRIKPGWLENSCPAFTSQENNQLIIRWPAAQDNLAVSGYRLRIRWSDGTSQTYDAGDKLVWTIPCDQPGLACEISVYAYDDASQNAALDELSRLVLYAVPQPDSNGAGGFTASSDSRGYFPDDTASVYLVHSEQHHWRPSKTGLLQPLEVPWDISAIYGSRALPLPPDFRGLLIIASAVVFLLLAILSKKLLDFRRKHKIRIPLIKSIGL
ncbi:MAG: hypothetical protein VB070_05790 [Clostridiaceae bacterium]|nr:hypothetical protein [Clostridiaceae bacterium]